MQEKILIIVESPLQLINANEYLKKHAPKCVAEFILISSRDKNNIQQLDNTFKGLRLNGKVKRINVDYIDKGPVTRLKFYYKIIRAAQGLKNERYNVMLIGHIASIYQAIIANAVGHCPSSIYLDDGTAALHEHRILKKKRIKSFSPLYKRIFPMALGLKANVKYNENGKMAFFTMYKDVVEDNHPYLQYQVNGFSYLKREYKKKKIRENVVYFIGTPFYWNSPSLNTSKNIFQEVSKSYQKEKVFYFPHRYETQEHLDLAKKCGWKIMETKVPIEISLINIPELPSEFGMFTSTAYYTLNRLIPNIKFKSFELNNLGDIFNGENTFKLYKEYEDYENISLVKLKE